MEELTTQGLIEQTKNLLHAVRGSSIKIGENLYLLKQGVEVGTNWGDMIRDEFDISESFASKLMSIHKAFVLDGGISQEKLEGIDGEKLYLAMKLEGTAEEKLAKASTLTRRDLKEERNDEKPHEHEPITLCKICSLRL
jgi:hypothetical protein